MSRVVLRGELSAYLKLGKASKLHREGQQRSEIYSLSGRAQWQPIGAPVEQEEGLCRPVCLVIRNSPRGRQLLEDEGGQEV